MLSFLVLTLALSTPFILGAMGGFTSERAGVINIGLEGIMLTAACVVCLTSPSLGAFGGLAVGIIAAVLLSILHWLATQIYRIDHVISGMAVNAIAAGGTNFLFLKFTDNAKSGSIPHIHIAFYEAIAFILPLFLWWYVKYSRAGLRLLAVGSDPDKARLAGITPVRVRFTGLVATGVFCGLGGAMLVSYTETFTDGMTSGRGYIALAALILGGWRPVPAFLSCLAFGFLSALQIQCQGVALFGVQPPSQVWACLPYLVTVIALAGFLGRNQTPQGLGKP